MAESHVPPLVDALSRPPPDELDLEHPADAQDGLGELEPRDAGGEVERFGARLAAPTSGVEIVRFGRPEVLAEIVAAAVFSARACAPSPTSQRPDARGQALNPRGVTSNVPEPEPEPVSSRFRVASPTWNLISTGA